MPEGTSHVTQRRYGVSVAHRTLSLRIAAHVLGSREENARVIVCRILGPSCEAVSVSRAAMRERQVLVDAESAAISIVLWTNQRLLAQNIQSNTLWCVDVKIELTLDQGGFTYNFVSAHVGKLFVQNMRVCTQARAHLYVRQDCALTMLKRVRGQITAGGCPAYASHRALTKDRHC